VIFMDELPKMSGWKVLRRALRERFDNFPLPENVKCRRPLRPRDLDGRGQLDQPFIL
jgi:hypothetical protein